ncbi:hypothetical protein MTR67_042940 [Solanum verrucosum]|uniref:Uncharacterized protein n=1 Tax=Solanum verrucosum TaxID=315347 RepID=A0AAF0UN86_SOLVR|nr:hypothetical protein MTR67_042940 [Solanum verrucosum]
MTFQTCPNELAEELNQGKSTLQVPVVDLSGIEVQDRRKEVANEKREASERWGFFSTDKSWCSFKCFGRND